MSNSMPKIAVVLPIEKPKITDEHLAMYFNAVIAAGGSPFLLPVTTNSQLLNFMLSEADGLLITGGLDFESQRFGSDFETYFERDYDDHSFLVFDIAMKLELPIFGICRGEQLMNVAMGGTLIPDIPNHRHVTHQINCLSGIVAQALEDESFMVNSFHHQVIDKVAPNFVVTARSAEGFVEAIEYTLKPYMVGVQWHPERQYDKYMNALLKSFIDACKS